MKPKSKPKPKPSQGITCMRLNLHAYLEQPMILNKPGSSRRLSNKRNFFAANKFY